MQLTRGLPSSSGEVYVHALNRGASCGPGELFNGDAYDVAPGHTPVLYADTKIVEFSPTNDLQRTMGVASKNMESVAV